MCGCLPPKNLNQKMSFGKFGPVSENITIVGIFLSGFAGKSVFTFMESSPGTYLQSDGYKTLPPQRIGDISCYLNNS